MGTTTENGTYGNGEMAGLTMVLEGAPACLTDVTGPADVPDGSVGFGDLLLVLSRWGSCAP